MKNRLIFLILFCTAIIYGQEAANLPNEAATYFEEVRKAAQLNKDLWGIDIYGPIILVNPITRLAYTNYPDSAGSLKQEGKIYSGILPNNILIANRSIKWNGQVWAMIMTSFLPTDSKGRIELFAHELFHKAQPSLNFSQLYSKNNDHLSMKDGRIYLRLELEALIKAFKSINKDETIKHLTNALTFRKYRYTLYPGADISENSFELNEGIASYTGAVISGRTRQETVAAFEVKIKKYLAEPSYVKTFAYMTIPVYGFLLRDINLLWNKEIDTNTNLTDYFISKFGLSIPLDLVQAVENITPQYNGQSIAAEETERDEKNKKLIASYKNKFLDQPHFEIEFEKKSISFDARYLVPIENIGTVYPTMKATDMWGILTVDSEGALVSPNKDKVTLTTPVKIAGNEITGTGWTLKLNDGYTIVKQKDSGNYKLIKNSEK